MVHHTESVLGPVNILVNSAGVMYYTMMKNLKEEQWEKQVDLNCKVCIFFLDIKFHIHFSLISSIYCN